MSLIRDADLLQDGVPTAALLRNCIEEHKKLVGRYEKLRKYYYGEHDILDRTRTNSQAPNNKLVCNHAEYIVDISTGYFLGNPIKYRAESTVSNQENSATLDITPITDNFKDVDIHSHDVELDRDRSIYGLSLEICFATDDDSPIVDFAEISPEKGFLVVDDTVKHKPLFGVNYYPQYDVNGVLNKYAIFVYTKDALYKYTSKVLEEPSQYELVEVEPHYFNMVPMIEYKNKKSLQGDFEQVISLIDAYNLLQSDRVNDKQQFVDALLVVYGSSFGDDVDEASRALKILRDMGMLEMPKDSRVEWAQKTLNEAEVEVLKKALKDDIHEFSKVPCLSDANFASTDSGVALAYKLLAFEMLIKQKENYFRQGTKQRIRLMCNFYNIKGYNLDSGAIDIEMTRSLPINRAELVNMVVALENAVSDETRLSLLDFIDDPGEELKKLKADIQEKIKIEQKEFGSYPFKQGSDADEEEN